VRTGVRYGLRAAVSRLGGASFPESLALVTMEL
jgi:hypothetical protein